jgi:gamma-glutamylcyclotransferase (GGCT)/AIG2-like uncharacterized protein YtfP
VNRVFVYGLLKPGFSLHHVVEPVVRRSETATARGRLYDAGVPAARFDEDGEIAGYVFWLDPGRLRDALEMLDDLEDEGDRYRRIVVEATTAEGTVDAFAYEYLDPLEGRPDVGGAWPGTAGPPA